MKQIIFWFWLVLVTLWEISWFSLRSDCRIMFYSSELHLFLYLLPLSLCCCGGDSTSSGVQPWIRGRSRQRLKLCWPGTSRRCLRAAAAPRRPRTTRTTSAPTVRVRRTDWLTDWVTRRTGRVKAWPCVDQSQPFYSPRVTVVGFDSVSAPPQQSISVMWLINPLLPVSRVFTLG